MAKLAKLIFKPIYHFVTAFKQRAILRQQLLLRKRLDRQRITSNTAFEHEHACNVRKRSPSDISNH